MEAMKRIRRLGAAVQTGGMTVIPVEQAEIHASIMGGRLNGSAMLAPVGALVIFPGGAAFYGIDGRMLAPDGVWRIDPELAAQIAGQYPGVFTAKEV